MLSREGPIQTDSSQQLHELRATQNTSQARANATIGMKIKETDYDRSKKNSIAVLSEGNSPREGFAIRFKQTGMPRGRASSPTTIERANTLILQSQEHRTEFALMHPTAMRSEITVPHLQGQVTPLHKAEE
jgi:hypothetical protein